MPLDQLTFPVSSRIAGSFQTVLLDDFEANEIRPNGSNSSPPNDLLWSQFQSSNPRGGAAGFEEISTEESHSGSRSLKITITGNQGEFYPHFYPYPDAMHHYVQPPSAWQIDTLNRMRFWIKFPPGVTRNSRGNFNFNIGTYLRCSTCGGQEDGGGHWYHHYDFDYTGEWHQVIVDTHPSHVRGAQGNTEHGDQEYVTGEPGWNYFDALTRFYINLNQGPTSFPEVYYLDGFELYEDTNPENIDQVYSLHGVYVPSSNTIDVGWSADKDEFPTIHEVRHSFSDIHASGWDVATQAPQGMVARPGSGGFSGMMYKTDQIDVSGHDKVCIAVKPQNSNLFRQIVIPIGT